MALPSKFGQSLEVFPHQSNIIQWRSYDVHRRIWFEVVIDARRWEILFSSDDTVASILLRLIRLAHSMNPEFQIDGGYNVWTNLDFERSWGLGSSSSLVSLIAQWIDIDPFQLGREVFGGSGYDIACATSEKPVIYNLENGNPKWIQIDFFPGFHSQLCFVHLKNKKDTREAIQKYYLTSLKNKGQQIDYINQLTEEISKCTELSEFNRLLEEHESIVSSAIGLLKVGDDLFSDFPGSIKSLGAWGGDFILASSPYPIGKTITYFNLKGYSTVILFEDMILK